MSYIVTVQTSRKVNEKDEKGNDKILFRLKRWCTFFYCYFCIRYFTNNVYLKMIFTSPDDFHSVKVYNQ